MSDIAMPTIDYMETIKRQSAEIERLRAALREGELAMREMGMLSNARYKAVCAALGGSDG